MYYKNENITDIEKTVEYSQQLSTYQARCSITFYNESDIMEVLVKDNFDMKNSSKDRALDKSKLSSVQEIIKIKRD